MITFDSKPHSCSAYRIGRYSKQPLVFDFHTLQFQNVSIGTIDTSKGATFDTVAALLLPLVIPVVPEAEVWNTGLSSPAAGLLQLARADQEVEPQAFALLKTFLV